MAEGNFPPGLSAGEKAVIVLLESIALGLGLTGVEMLLLHGSSFYIVVPVWIVAVLISYCGFSNGRR